jgi:DNA-binding FadR family transcriptional regulator
VFGNLELNGMKLRRIPTESLVDTVVERLRDYIDRQKLTTGNRLPSEPQLVLQLNVSRSVLREAIGRLQTIGMLDVQHGRGTFIGSGTTLISSAQLMRSALGITPHALMQFVDFRTAIESYSARQVALIATDAQFSELEKLLDQMDRPEVGYVESIHMDFQFHYKLVEITGNEPMMNVFKVLQEFIMAAMVKTTPAPRNVAYSRKIHRELFEAMRSRDPKLAGAAIEHHMELARIALQSIADQQQ